MIRQIRGGLTDVELGFAVVDVGGLGYLVHTNAATGALKVGDEVLFYTHLAVRENAHDLYGFLTKEELEFFELLIELPKIGPKSALQILTQADVNLLRKAVRNEDPGYLTKLSGIGKKSAEKIVSGLKDKLEAQEFDDADFAGKEGRATGHMPDTVDALIALGYPQMEARRIVLKISTDNPDVKTPTEALKLALKILSN